MIEVTGVTKKFNDLVAVRDVSFCVNEGELFGIIGPDGAGKTTLFRMVASLLVPDHGRISILGLDPVKQYSEVRKMIGYMPGRFSLYHDLTVEENIDFFAAVFGTTVKENYSLVKDIYSQIEPFKKRKAGALSGGMKQKLALSCALIHQPRLLILDEPTTGVDAVSRHEFWQMLLSLKRTGMTILVSTPYMDEASLCDQIALMQSGRIMEIESPGNIEKRFEKKLFGIKAGARFRLIQTLKSYPYSHAVYPFGEYLHYIDRRAHIGAEELVQYLFSEGFQDAEVVEVNPNIEDRFIELMCYTNEG